MSSCSTATTRRRGGRRLAPALLEVTADSDGSTQYFPERYLSCWFRGQGEEVPVYCFERTGARPVRAGYEALAAELKLDAVVLVDGGTDSLMRGDEADLGTPEEDIASIAAADHLDVPRKLLVCVGFGIDTFHGVCHAHFLESVSALIAAGGYLGTFSLLWEMPEVQRYREAAAHVFRAMPHHVSIVTSSVLSALEGRFGNHHATARTAGSELWINPLMSLCWCFRLRSVAERILYLNEMKQTETYMEVEEVILSFRARCRASIRPWQNIPV